MDEARFGRLENRVDQIKDDIADVRAKQEVTHEAMHSLGERVKEHTESVKAHVAGDEKIITAIQPLIDILPHLTEVVKNHQYTKETKKRKMYRLKYWSLKLGIPSVVIAIIGGSIKIFVSFY